MHRTSAIVCCLVALVATGCGTITAHKVTYEDATTEGVRYWLPTPYLMVSEPVSLFETQSLWTSRGNELVRLCEADCPAADAPPADARDEDRAAARRYETDRGDELPIPGRSPAGEDRREASDDKPAPTGNDGKKLGGGGKPAVNPGAISIVWLPDYCQMYAVQGRAGLGSQSLKVTLEDGWRLSSIDSETDNTQILESLTSLAKTFLETRADVKTAEIEAATDEDAAPKEKARVPAKVYRKTVSYGLRPGLYRLVDQKDCQRPTLLDPMSFYGLGNPESPELVESITWEELKS